MRFSEACYGFSPKEQDNTEVLERINLFHKFTVDDNRTIDSSISTEVNAHLFGFGNIQM